MKFFTYFLLPNECDILYAGEFVNKITGLIENFSLWILTSS